MALKIYIVVDGEPTQEEFDAAVSVKEFAEIEKGLTVELIGGRPKRPN